MPMYRYIKRESVGEHPLSFKDAQASVFNLQIDIKNGKRKVAETAQGPRPTMLKKTNN